MSTLNFKDWLLQLEMGNPLAPVPTVTDPSVTAAQQMVKAKLTNPDPTKPLATQARKTLGQAAATAPNPMAIAQLDQGNASAQPGVPQRPGM